MTGGVSDTRTRPHPKRGSDRGRPVEGRGLQRREHRSASPGRPATRSAAIRMAAAPAAFGAALDVPPTPRTPLGPRSEVSVGATRSGFRRPSGLGPCDEYRRRRSPRQSTAPTAIAPRASAGLGTLPAVVPPAGARRTSRENSVSGPMGTGPAERCTRTR